MEYVRFLRDNAKWLAAGVLLTFSSSYGQTYFISIFAGEIMGRFSLSHGQWGAIYTLGTAASAVVMIWSGALTDQFRVRQLGAVILALLAVACFFMASVPSVFALPFAIFALRLFGQGMASHIAIVGMARWFVATRGRAMSIATLGFAAGQAILPVVFVVLLVLFDWRALWVAVGIVSLLSIPVLLWLLKQERTPQSIAKESPSVGMNGDQWTRKAVLHHWLFWLLVPSLLGPAAWGTALLFQQVHLTQVKGWSHVEFVSLLPLFTLVSILTTFATGWALDKFGTSRLMPLLMLPYAMAFMILAAADSIGMAALGLAVFGIGTGASSTLPAAFSAEYFGTRHIGSIKALFAAIMVLGSALGPGITGWLIDLGIDFPDQMNWLALYFVAAAILVTIGIRWARPMLSVPA